MPRKSRPTQTSSFGSPGRSSHDASAFYNSKMYAGLEALASENGVNTGESQLLPENPLPPENINRIFYSSAERMAELPDRSVHLMVTSPPYNVGKDYDADLTLDDYLAFLKRVWCEVLRTLAPGGRTMHQCRQPGAQAIHPAARLSLFRICSTLGFQMRGEIIWDKAASAAASTAWGSWRSAANPTLRDVHEYILVFSKDTFRRQPPTPQANTITRDEFLEYTKSIWTFPAESARKVGHPAPFPIELPYRLIQLYSFANDIVLDPFMGSGQTALAALKAGRRYVGYEVDAGYVQLAQRRIRDYALAEEAGSAPSSSTSSTGLLSGS